MISGWRQRYHSSGVWIRPLALPVMTSWAKDVEFPALSVVVYASGRNGSGIVVCSGSCDHVGYFAGEGTIAHADCLGMHIAPAEARGRRDRDKDRSPVTAVDEGAMVA